MIDPHQIEPHQSAVNVLAELLSKSFDAAVSWTLDPAPLERIAPPEAGSEGLRWFRQTFSGLPGLELQVGIPAGAEFLENPDALPAVFSKLAAGLSTALRLEISALQLSEEEPLLDPQLSFFQVGGSSGVRFAVADSMLESLASRLPARSVGPAAKPSARTLDALMDVDLPVSISFGSVQVPLGDVLKLTTGSIVEFHHPLNAPVNVIVNNRIVARGDVVDVDGHYGVRVSEIVSRGTFA
jgi:flagellar motor switch protein FliN